MCPDSDDTSPAPSGSGVLGNGTDAVYDRVEYQYNRQGQQTQVKDQNQTVHDYLFDAAGRLAEDEVTTLGTGVDGAVRKIAYGYEERGMLNKVTSKQADGTVVDEVLREYNDWGLLTKEYQSHSGPVDADQNGTPDAGVPVVEYLYEDAANPTRLTGMVYPNGRELTYDYAAGADDALGRVTAILDD